MSKNALFFGQKIIKITSVEIAVDLRRLDALLPGQLHTTRTLAQHI